MAVKNLLLSPVQKFGATHGADLPAAYEKMKADIRAEILEEQRVKKDQKEADIPVDEVKGLGGARNVKGGTDTKPTQGLSMTQLFPNFRSNDRQ